MNNPGFNCSDPIEKYMNSDEIKNYSNYYKLISPWAKTFGKKNIIIKPYEKEQLPDGLIKNFSEIVGINNFKNFDFTTESVNPSLEVIANELLRIFNKLFLQSVSNKKHKPVYCYQLKNKRLINKTHLYKSKKNILKLEEELSKYNKRNKNKGLYNFFIIQKLRVGVIFNKILKRILNKFNNRECRPEDVKFLLDLKGKILKILIENQGKKYFKKHYLLSKEEKIKYLLQFEEENKKLAKEYLNRENEKLFYNEQPENCTKAVITKQDILTCIDNIIDNNVFKKEELAILNELKKWTKNNYAC